MARPRPGDRREPRRDGREGHGVVLHEGSRPGRLPATSVDRTDDRRPAVAPAPWPARPAVRSAATASTTPTPGPRRPPSGRGPSPSTTWRTTRPSASSSWRRAATSPRRCRRCAPRSTTAPTSSSWRRGPCRCPRPRGRSWRRAASSRSPTRGSRRRAASSRASLRAGDLFAPHALFDLVLAIQDGHDAAYGDEDRYDEVHEHHDGHLKPSSFGRETLYSYDVVGAPLLARTALLLKLGGYDAATSPVAEHDLALRLSEATDRLAHVDSVLVSRPLAQAPDPADATAATVSIVTRAFERVGATAHGDARRAAPVGQRTGSTRRPRRRASRSSSRRGTGWTCCAPASSPSSAARPTPTTRSSSATTTRRSPRPSSTSPRAATRSSRARARSTTRAS